jgi:hypothetical protein
MEYTLAYGLRRQSAAAAALWLSAALSAQAKAVSRSACHRTPNIPRLTEIFAGGENLINTPFQRGAWCPLHPQKPFQRFPDLPSRRANR